MTLTKLDLKSINQVVKETINENLDRRLGPNLEKIGGLLNRELDKRLALNLNLSNQL